MQKIISLFCRNYETDRLVRNEIVPGAEWAVAGEGIATRKYDGTCCMVQDGVLYKRYEVKRGRTWPNGFVPAQEPDPVTGEVPGWIKVGDGPEDKWHRESWVLHDFPGKFPDGTYELVGPKIQGNPEDFGGHVLINHDTATAIEGDVPRDFDGIKQYLFTHDIEGIVWHHPDGRMVKIKGKDFGIKRSMIAKEK